MYIPVLDHQALMEVLPHQLYSYMYNIYYVRSIESMGYINSMYLQIINLIKLKKLKAKIIYE